MMPRVYFSILVWVTAGWLCLLCKLYFIIAMSTQEKPQYVWGHGYRCVSYNVSIPQVREVCNRCQHCTQSSLLLFTSGWFVFTIESYCSASFPQVLAWMMVSGILSSCLLKGITWVWLWTATPALLLLGWGPSKLIQEASFILEVSKGVTWCGPLDPSCVPTSVSWRQTLSCFKQC